MVLIPLADASKIYHTIRGQDTIKLYVIFNALEVSYAISLSSAVTYRIPSDRRPPLRVNWPGHPGQLIFAIDA